MRGPFVRSGLLQQRFESGKLLAPAEVASEVSNMRVTEEGTLRSVQGPTPYLPWYTWSAGPTGRASNYGTMHGIFHCIIDGHRDVLLTQEDDTIQVFEGWTRNWKELVGVSGQINTRIENDDTPRFPAQFESVPGGVVIIPQGGRPLFYDGIMVAPLGFDQAPAPPTLNGPITDSSVNDAGYAINPQSAVWYPQFGACRIGTIDPVYGYDAATLVVTSSLMDGEWEGAVQFVDRWGNLSPVSARSNKVQVSLESDTSADAKFLRYQLAWTGIDFGPSPHTWARILYRTRDLLHSGTSKLFEMPQNAAGGTHAFATIPDNMSDYYPDNTGDSWLLIEAPDIVPVPRFRLCKMAFGRLFAANALGDVGLIRWSMPGRWGTFEADAFMYPDTGAAEITGLCVCKAGLLAFTRTTTFLITPSDDGRWFRAQTLSAGTGCSAPSSIATMPNGLVVWLSDSGFYGFDGQNISQLSVELDVWTRRFNRPRLLQACAAVCPASGEYRCWVAIDSSLVNNMCFIFDGGGWRRRTDTEARAVCTTRNHLGYMLVAGTAFGKARVGASVESVGSNKAGVWVLDHRTYAFIPNARNAKLVTSWISAAVSTDRRTAMRVVLWLREMGSGTLTVNVMRDWRNTVIQTSAVDLYPTDDQPPFWGTAAWADGSEWKRRRPYWVRADIYVPSCEVFKLEVTSTQPWEIVGMVVEESTRASQARTPP